MSGKLHDGLNWSAFAKVDKYSEEQVAFVRKITGVQEPTGVLLEQYLNTPEMGTVEAPGNLLTTVGLTRITSLITGSGSALNTTQSVVGVGDGGGSVPTAAVGDTDLTAATGATHRWLQAADATFPTTSLGVITIQATFSTSNANFAWNEWCWVISTGTITAGSGAITSSAPGSTGNVMLNHKGIALGTKVATATWVLTSTVTLS
jgi:hypothetical protein